MIVMGGKNSVRREQIAAVVVLYNSPPDSLAAIKTYWNQVDKMYVIDNSLMVAPWVQLELASRPRVAYQQFSQNIGIATALNTAARLAIADGYDYLLTMDDDSLAPTDMVSKLLAYLNENQAETIGILSPRHNLLTADPPRPDGNQLATSVLTVMTSGNLLSLKAYERVGPFWDELFIDVVDHDYNLRLNTSGYRIIELPAVHLAHRLGEQKSRFGNRLRFVSHSPVRNYYLVRNSLAVAVRHWRQHPGYMLHALRTIGIELVKGVLLENNRWVRGHLMARGIADGVRQRLGKLV